MQAGRIFRACVPPHIEEVCPNDGSPQVWRAHVGRTHVLEPRFLQRLPEYEKQTTSGPLHGLGIGIDAIQEGAERMKCLLQAFLVREPPLLFTRAALPGVSCGLALCLPRHQISETCDQESAAAARWVKNPQAGCLHARDFERALQRRVCQVVHQCRGGVVDAVCVALRIHMT